jgi:hypothetical protein
MIRDDKFKKLLLVITIMLLICLCKIIITMTRSQILKNIIAIKNPHQINDEDFLFSHSVPIAIWIFRISKTYSLINLMICCLLFSITLTK